VIRNTVIHLAGEQPIVADLEQMPLPSDVGILCSNVRYADGKKPNFIDHTESTFLFPMIHVRFIEIPAADIRRDLPALAMGDLTTEDEELLDLEPDEDFLRRIREA
jgi:hypothetical protein